MKEISFEESKRIMVGILESIDKCCRENNLKYSLGWGTLIGAVRHHGFIPWDDDIDVLMPRDDYNTFLNIYNDSEYGIYTPKSTKNCIQIITKIYKKGTCVYFNNFPKSIFGVWVSIFPYDNAPDHNLKQWEYKRTFWMHLYHFKTARFLTTDSLQRRILKYILKTIVLPFSPFWLYNKVEACLTEYNSLQTKKVCLWPGIEFTNFVYFPKELFDEYKDVDFEGIKAKIIKGYDEYLRLRYGDYMIFPPESERVPKHNYKAYYI